MEEDGSGNVYRWVLRFEDGSSVIVTEDVGARAAARSWKINGSPAVGIEINRMHFRGVTTDLKKSIDWSFESGGSEAVSLDQGNPNSSQIEYDPKKALHARIFNDFVMETTGCLRTAVKTALAIGRRNRNEILSWATQTCGGKVPYIYETIGRPQQEGRAYIAALAETQLNDVLKYGQ